MLLLLLKKEKSLLWKIYRYVWILRPKAATETSLLYLILIYNDLFLYIFIFFFYFFIVFIVFFIFQVSFCFLCDVIFLFSFFVLFFFVVVVFFFLFIVRCSCFHVKNLFAPLVFEEQVNLKFWLFQWNIVKLKKNH